MGLRARMSDLFLPVHFLLRHQLIGATAVMTAVRQPSFPPDAFAVPSLH